MVLEATVVCLDNSEFMRNGDYMPSRLEAQQDAVNLITAAKTQSNPESTVAVMTMAQSKSGTRSEVLVTLTQDLGKILSSLHSIKIAGDLDFSSSMQVAQLVLKHRQNKNQHQRVVAFVGSPLKEDTEELVKLAKKLKKNNIAVDLVNFGEETHNTEKLEAFLNALNTNNESHLITVPPGPHILSDILLSSPIVVEGGAGGFAAAAAASAAAAAAHGAGGGDGFDFGVDPNMDPELAMAIRLSMEEERARQEAEARKQAEQAPSASATSSTSSAPPTAAAVPPPVPSQDVEMPSADDDELLRQAIEMSKASAASGGDVVMAEEDDEVALALQMSLGSQGTSSGSSGSSAKPALAADVNAVLQDQDFLNSVLSSLPGVDPNDERIKNVLQTLSSQKKDDQKNSGNNKEQEKK